MSTLAERLTEARNDRGWKKSELQHRAGMKSSSTLTELEKGTIFKSPQLPQIAAALGVEVMWLQFGKGPKWRTPGGALPAAYSDLALEAAKIIDAMTEDEQIEILHYLHVDQAKRKMRKRASESLIDDARAIGPDEHPPQ